MSEVTVRDEVEHTDPAQRGSGRTLTLVSGIGVLLALAALLFFVARSDETSGGAGAVAGLPGGKLTVGLQDERLPVAPLNEIPSRLDRLKASGATYTRVDVLWAQVAPTRPAAPKDPADRAYEWARTDAIIDGLRDRKIKVMVAFSQAPGWTNANRTPEWFGSMDDYANFVHAFAIRYSGVEHGLVTIYEPWNEPNSAASLMPQWEGAGTDAKVVSAATYAGILARAATEIAAVSPGSTVAGLGLADIVSSTPGVGSVGVRDFVAALVPLKPKMRLVSQHLAPQEPPATVTDRVPSIGGMSQYLTMVDQIAPEADVLISAVGYATPPGGLSEAEQAEDVGATMTALARTTRVRLAIWYSMQDTIERAAGLIRADGGEKPAWKAFVDQPKTLRSGGTP